MLSHYYHTHVLCLILTMYLNEFSFIPRRTSAKVKPVYQFFCCVECGEGYSNSESLDEHRKEIHGSKKFMCDICSIGFKTEEILLKHKETDHFNQELFICPTCSSTFASKSALNKHIKIHLKTGMFCHVTHSKI